MYDWLFLEVVRAGRYILTAGDPEVERAGRYIWVGAGRDMMPQHVERTNIQNKAKFVFHKRILKYLKIIGFLDLILNIV